MLLILSSIIFLFFGIKLHFEEDMSKLLPSSESNECEVVFGNLKIKDKIILQMRGATPETLALYMDSLMQHIMDENEDIANSFYRLDEDDLLYALDFVLEHLPSFVDTSLYPKFDTAIAHVGSTMEQNREIIMNDETGSLTQMVCNDPLNLRQYLLPDMSAGMGFTLIDNQLFTSDSTVAIAFISPDFQSFDSKSGSRLVKRVRYDVEQFSLAHPDVEILFHGAPVRSAGNSQVMKRDIAFTIGISLLVIFFVLCISFAGGRIIWQNLFPVAYGAFFSLACMYWLKGGMSLMALGIGSVVLGVSLSYCLHLIIHQHFVSDVIQMLSEEAKPVCLGCITTIGAFLGLMFTQSELLHDFGLFATFALLGTTFAALVFLPHFLPKTAPRINKRMMNVVNRINSFPYDRNVFVIVVLGIAIIVGIVFASDVKFDNNLKHIGYESEALLRSEAIYAEKNYFGGLQRHYASVASTLEESLEQNQLLANRLDSFMQEGKLLQYMPVVSSLFPSEKTQRQRIMAWNSYWDARKVKEACQAVAEAASANHLPDHIFQPFQAMVESDYEIGNLYDAGVIPDGMLCNFIEKSDGKYLAFNSVLLDSTNRDAMDSSMANMSHVVVADPFFYTGNMISLIHHDFRTILAISSLFVLVVLLIAFRNVLTAILAFLPMFLSSNLPLGIKILLKITGL